jgi:curli biogenesis system outer membrane secretion channel CsgG
MLRTLISLLACAVILAPLASAVAAEAPNAQTTKPAYRGPRKSVAVDVVGAPEASGGAMTNEGLIAMFDEALSSDGRFLVVERAAIADVQAEQQVGATEETRAKAGKLLGASALVRATVTKFEPNAGGGGLQLGGLPSLGGFSAGGGVKGQYAIVEISLRLVDNTTGEIIATSKAEGRASSGGAHVGVMDDRTGANVGANTFKTTPLGKAAAAAISAAVEKIALGLDKVPWSAQIVEAADGRAYVNIGSDQNIPPGTVLKVYRKTKTLTDPTTGALLEVLMDDVGSIEIQEVRERVSTAKVIGDGAVNRGDIVRLP